MLQLMWDKSSNNHTFDLYL